ncbi:DNA-binding MarR family transcriptional regulator [Sphingobium sp. B11D3B]|uniref:MarR family winged helix-turn-helix transcriptional regulator n=1 Tax=unclassified Sphingobium TaxID=2611147 RepID=UPI001314DE62|nr:MULTISPECIES: MarR family winged helix-turn-helix transcriptional regulator [unclassified Sphingobium]MCW2365851.1 DNA-binding MarR family transcriptional regulator [Sphingobium sp. B7D2B]MCW2388550.1 DNA-binding MarR family transcriptional regulator [Sphingobium sp. B11D3B]
MEIEGGTDLGRKISTGAIDRIPAELRQRVLGEGGDWFGLRMILIGNYYSAEAFAALAQDHGLLRDEFTILGYLSDYGEMTANVICAMSGRPKNSISRGVIKLTANKLITARPSEEDRRYMVLDVTDEGRALYMQAMKLFREREEEIFGFLSRRDLAKLDDLLMKILAHWHAR